MFEYFNWKKKAMLNGADTFWLPAGFSRANVLAAYQFKGVADADFAKMDLSGNGYNLTATAETDTGGGTGSHIPTWSSAGFSFDAVYQGKSGYLDNSSLDTQTIRAAVICFSGVTQDNRAYLVTAGGASGKAQIYAATTALICEGWADYQPVNLHVQPYRGPGFCNAAYANSGWVGQMKYYGSSYKASGVIGVNFDSAQMYIDGVSVTSSLSSTPSGMTYADLGANSLQGKTFGNNHTNASDLNNAIHSGKTIIAAVFYSAELSDEQQLRVANAMLAM